MLKGTYRFRLTPADISEMAPHIPPEELEEVRRNAPPPPPPHTITFLERDGIPVGIYESEHGKQLVGNLCYTGEIVRFTALAGTPGDEFFLYALKLHEDGKLEGEAYQAGKPHSPLVGERIAE